MDFFKTIRKYYFIAERVFMMWFLPLFGFFVLSAHATPLGETLKIKFSQDVLLSLLVFFITTIGAKLISLAAEKEHSSRTVEMVNQSEWLEAAFRLIPKHGTDLKILIYTSYSILNRLEPLIQKYPNEPWVRGVKIGDSDLFYSTYSDKRAVDKDEKEIEYSGSRTPWIHIKQSNASSPKDEMNFIAGFNSLFDLAWSECTKYKSIVFDLDGTLFKDKNLSNYLSDELPVAFIEATLTASVTDAKKLYFELRGKGFSGTESIIKAINDSQGDVITTLPQYVEWKNSKIPDYPLDIKRNPALISALEAVNENYHLHLITNHTEKFCRLALDKLGIQELFKQNNILTIEKMKHAKPSSELISVISDSFGPEFSKSIYIGDREYVDFSYISNICMATILIEDVSSLPALLQKMRYPLSCIADGPGYQIKMRRTGCHPQV
jgi:FMN phosphatase YigB (HAD superfamily)